MAFYRDSFTFYFTLIFIWYFFKDKFMAHILNFTVEFPNFHTGEILYTERP
jgi:hypothetical protein